MPQKYHETRIRLAEQAVTWHMARRLADPTSAPYMRACVRKAIADIRTARAALAA